MKRTPAQLRYTSGLRRTRLAETRFGPALALALLLALLGALVFCVVRFGLPALRARLARPEAEPAAALVTGPEEAESMAQEPVTVSTGTVALVDVADVEYLFDPSVNDDTILFAAGMSEDTLDRLVRYDTVTGEAEGVLVPMQYDTLRNPVEDDARIVYVDAKRDGGGAIRALDKETGAASLVCDVASDIPVLSYETPYLLWRERASDGTVRLYACHLGTGDEITLAVADTDIAAYSAPSLFAGSAVYAEADLTDDTCGVVRTVHLSDGTVSEYAPGMYVQDPKRAEGVLAYTAGRHGADNDLYCVKGDGAPVRVAAGVIDFGLAARHIAYGLDGAVHAYDPETGKTVQLSGGGYAQFAAAGGNVVVWRALDNAGNLGWKYMRMD